MLIHLLLYAGFLTVAAFAVYSGVPTIVVRGKYFLFGGMRGCGKSICLTFDDGPSSEYTGKLLDLLEEQQIKATFFVVAKFAGENPMIVQRMKAEGHKICLHSQSHKCPLFQGWRDTRKSMKQSMAVMEALNIDIEFFRPPWGTMNLALAKEIRERDLQLVLWNDMAGDWSGSTTAEKIAERLDHIVKAGDVVCLHDGRGKNKAPARTIKALEKMLPAWKAEGYRFVKVDDIYGTTKREAIN